IQRCLEKDPEARYPSTGDLRDDLARVQEGDSSASAAASIAISKRAAAAVVLALISIASGIVLWTRRADVVEPGDEPWSRKAALAEIASLVDEGELSQAYLLARTTEGRIPGDPELETLMERFTLPGLIKTVPESAEVSFKPYETPEAEWHALGTTPLQTRLPYGMMRLRIAKDGFETIEGAPFEPGANAAFRRGLPLEPTGTRPQGMVRVEGGPFRPAGIPRLPPSSNPEPLVVGSYWLDRFEVTNREFQEFVAAGGYRDQPLWQEPFVTAERELTFAEAIDSFRDTTGRPGPATWELGTYPEGTAEQPVGGVSWYEAAAYCRWAGKSLPTIYHWFHAIGQAQRSEILRFSNFSDRGPAPVGSYQGLAGWGSYDMAGNVKEWCWNPTSEGRRYVLGGAWNDRSYIFKHLVARQPFVRPPTHGLRCASYPEPPAEVLQETVDPLPPRPPPSPISDEIFNAYVAMYDYEHTDLDARVEKVDDSSPYLIRQTVSFRTAYDDERMEAILFLPRNVAPPYQTVVWFPGGDAYAYPTSDTLASPFLFDFLPRSGRAVVYPIYWGTYERFKPPTLAPIEWRDNMLRWSKDVRRTIDYLETRPDFDTDRIAYYGFSNGALFGPVFGALEPRLAAEPTPSTGQLSRDPRQSLKAPQPRHHTQPSRNA
ncbi:MAG: SUMF1/EgtB/PvdO family nonheme iron enzyme, partial [Acidobacteria bacterium]|nr:SUMF1/EgtB/PvdO family nonheme iron enzyme [Acidobacteriota bacterium]